MAGRRIEVSKEKPVKPIDQPAPVLDWIPIARLVVDESYQRELGKANWTAIRKIAAEFRWSRVSPVLVAPIENGFFAVIDGQHRAHAAAICGFETIPAMMVQMTRSEQASAFAFVNGNVTRITLFHVYKAALAARAPWAERCMSVVESAGCSLMTYNKSTAAKKAGEIYAIGLIRQTVERGLAEHLQRALRTIRASDDAADPQLYNEAVLRIWIDIVAAKPGLRDDTLIAYLSAHNIVSTIDKATQLHRTPDFRHKKLSDLRRASVQTLLNDFVRRRLEAPAGGAP